MGDISIKGRSPLLKGGRVGLKKGGFPIRTTKLKRGADQEFTLQKGVSAAPIKQSRIADTGLHKGSVRKATSPKVMGTQRPKTKSDFWLKQSVKKIQKMPDKTFKYNNPGTRKAYSERTGRWSDVPKKDFVKGSIGKKKYIQDWKGYHHANKPKAKGGKV